MKFPQSFKLDESQDEISKYKLKGTLNREFHLTSPEIHSGKRGIKKDPFEQSFQSKQRRIENELGLEMRVADLSSTTWKEVVSVGLKLAQPMVEKIHRNPFSGGN